MTVAYLTPAEAARELRVSRRTIYRAIERRELPAARIGRSLRVPAARIVELERPVRPRPEETR